MSIALVYAAEAYHTKGAMRHVVGALQFKNKEIEEGLTMMDYWVSMIENWADVNKEFSHCENKKATECLLSMTKYLFRTFGSLKVIQDTLCYARAPANALKMAFRNETSKVCTLNINPVREKIRYWMVNYKGRVTDMGGNEATDFAKYVRCAPQVPNLALKIECMDKIQSFVQSVNDLLVMTTGRITTENAIMYKRNGKKKQMPI